MHRRHPARQVACAAAAAAVAALGPAGLLAPAAAWGATHHHGQHQPVAPTPVAPSPSATPVPGHGPEHAPAPVEAPDRPVAEVVGGFAALNGAVLVAAAVTRRRNGRARRP